MGKDSKAILCILTNNGVKGSSGYPTGFWLCELTLPLHEFINAEFAYCIASPLGGKSPMDPMSVDLKDPINELFMNSDDFKNQIENTIPLKDIHIKEYSAIFFPGGHGPLWDLPNNPLVHEMVKQLFESDGIISAVCHGPCALVNVQLSNKDYLVRGKKVVSFTNNEEIEMQNTEIVPFSVQTAMSNAHAKFMEMPNWSNNVIIDGNLITGQNPQSAASVGKAVVEAMLK